ncbi:polysaccharide biosynthesis C-terminal domain-containing protein [Vibrio sp. T3Y01]|uniref:oligosaccharide flippase family protein n=1 Tax=Vibrio sp. T3Y01 TaxID=2607606 RepID=UPI001493A24F|nr:polysaccharide biosynthesis C-terminal domain-containing protein [Vibrio sp. T3Y01]NOI95783.1 oligosaccharide flippase family protein [Vibrio sp. T3Y01]
MANFIYRIFNADGHFFILASLINKFSSFAIAIVLSRYLSVEGYSFITLLMSYVALGAPILSLGANQAILRNATLIEGNSEKSYYIIEKLKYLSFFYLFAFAFAFYLFKNDNQENMVIFLMVIYVIVSSVVNFLLAVIRVMNGNKLYSKLVSLTTLLTLMILFSLVDGFQVLAYPLSLLLIQLALLFYLFLKIIPYFKLIVKDAKSRPKIHRDNKKFFMYGGSIVLANFASQFSLNIDILMLEYFNFTEVLAIYRNASVLIVSILFIPAILIGNQYLEIVKVSGDRNKLKTFYLDYAKLSGPISILIVVGVYLLGDHFIRFSFGEKYIDSSSVLIILSLSLIPNFLLRTPIGNILSAMGRSNLNVILSFVCVAINIFLNYYLVPIYGLFGAAWSTVIAMYISSIFYLIALRSIINEKN